MNDLFGLSMNYIMYGLLALLVISLASIAYVGLANRVMFKLGVRNIPRRRAQTSLIVVGLMLSTVIISAAFTTGDTVDRSITSEVYNLLGSLDEVIHLTNDDDDGTFDDPGEAIQREPGFSRTAVIPLIDSLSRFPDFDAVVPAYSDLAVAVNLEKRLSSPLFNVLGLDVARSRDLPDIQDVRSRRHLRLDELGQSEIYINESAAEELAVQPGDSIIVFAAGKPTTFRVKAVVEDRRLAGAGGISVRREGGVLPLPVVQQLFDAGDQITMIAISNEGDSRGGLKHADSARDEIVQALNAAPPVSSGLELRLVTIKRTGVDIAEQGANLFTTFFLVLGLFSIGAGILLIFMIFVMLAAERKPEMGMARAVGTKRLDLVQTFLSEGMAYNVLAALVGCGLGVLVAFIMSRVMASIFSQFDINISPYVTLRSLIISYCLGVVLTFLTVTFSSWRVSNINIVRAIRDIPEPPVRRPLWQSRGFLRTLLSLVFKPGSGRSWGLRGGILVLGVVFQGAASAAGSTAPQIVLGMSGGLAIAAFVFLTFQMGFLFVFGSIPLIALGAVEHNAFALLFGLSLLPLGLAFILRSFGANERLTYTAVGVFLIYIWEIDFSVGLVEKLFGEANGNIEMFFLSGVMVTLAATFLVVYNSDLILGPITRLGSGLGALLPSLKMAVAYPLASKTRTGLTMAMFCLVVFALTVMSSMNHNFNRLFISDRALGGWDVTVDENPTNPIGDLKAKLAEVGSPAISKIEGVGVSALVSARNAWLCQPSRDNSCDLSPASKSNWEGYAVRGDDAGFFATAKIALQSRARGYASDEEAWQAAARDPSLAIIDAFALPGGGFGDNPGFQLKGIDSKSKDIDPIELRLANATTKQSKTVKVIGIVELGSSASYTGLHVSQQTLEDVFGRPDIRRYFVKTTPGSNNREVAREIESSLLTTGAQSESLRYQVDKQNATFKGFFYLMQGFMGLGLFVGVAAVGVIAFRTVAERRQQIGMLRALGYTRGMVGLTFLIESSFIAFMGVLSGIVFAVILARQLIHDEFANQGVTSFAVPWPQILIIGGAAFGFALLMTLIPSRQAAAIPIAQALRYE